MNERSRNLLLISHHFPPFGGSGVQRALKLAKYLPSCGWNIHVLTAGPRHHAVTDKSLLRDMGRGVMIHRVNGWDAGGIAARIGRVLPSGVERRLFWRLDRALARLPIEESESLWVRPAIRAARSILKSRPIDAIMTTSPPHCVQRIGLALRREFDVPWICDLRDPIVDNFAIEDRSPGAILARHDLEVEIAARADLVVVTCDDLRTRWLARHTALRPDSIVTITNGYDPDDQPAGVSKKHDRFVLGYVGSFYREQSIEPLLTAVRTFLGARPDAVGRFELRIAGSVAARQRDFVRDSDGAFLVERGYVEHAAALGEMASADALFLMTPRNEGGRYCIPAKAFEYLAFGRQIVAMVHPGSSLEQILNDAGSVAMVHHGDRSGLVAALAKQFDRWKEKTEIPLRSESALHEFRRDVLAGRLATALDSCVDSRAAVARNVGAPAALCPMIHAEALA